MEVVSERQAVMVPSILQRLQNVRKAGSGWTARCTAHDDRRNSLSISIGDDGRTLVHCHAGCEVEAVVSAAGLTMRDLASPNGNGKPGKRRIVKTYDYRDEAGTLLFQDVRYEPKDFRQRRPKPSGGLEWSVKGVRVVPYRLPELLSDPTKVVCVPEGEKDVDNLARIGVTATTNAGGAGKWTAEHAKHLAGRHVVILPDNDKPGRDHAAQVAASLQGIAATIKVVELPGLPEKGDVSDWIAAGGTKDQLRQLAEAAPLWTAGTPVSQVKTDQQPAAEPDDEPPEFVPFPVECFPEPIKSYVEAAAAALGCDLSFVAVPIIPALGAAVGNSRVVRLKHSWSEPCSFWSVTVGPSGTLKSPAWELAVRPLQQRQEIEFRRYREEMEHYERDLAMHDADYASWRKDGRKKNVPPPCKPDEPHAVRFIASDTTVEALAVLLEQNSRGVHGRHGNGAGWSSGSGPKAAPSRCENSAGDLASTGEIRRQPRRLSGNWRTLGSGVGTGVPPGTRAVVLHGFSGWRGLATKLSFPDVVTVATATKPKKTLRNKRFCHRRQCHQRLKVRFRHQRRTSRRSRVTSRNTAGCADAC